MQHLSKERKECSQVKYLVYAVFCDFKLFVIYEFFRQMSIPKISEFTKKCFFPGLVGWCAPHIFCCSKTFFCIIKLIFKLKFKQKSDPVENEFHWDTIQITYLVHTYLKKKNCLLHDSYLMAVFLMCLYRKVGMYRIMEGGCKHNIYIFLNWSS